MSRFRAVEGASGRKGARVGARVLEGPRLSSVSWLPAGDADGRDREHQGRPHQATVARKKSLVRGALQKCGASPNGETDAHAAQLVARRQRARLLGGATPFRRSSVATGRKHHSKHGTSVSRAGWGGLPGVRAVQAVRSGAKWVLRVLVDNKLVAEIGERHLPIASGHPPGRKALEVGKCGGG